MNDKLYHECYLRVSQAHSLLKDLQSWGYDTLARITPETSNPSKVAVEVPERHFQDLESLQNEVELCQLCSLSKTRTTVVFGRGNPGADLVFVGEAPGYEEDRQGLPFVGEAGRLLDRILFAMELSAADVYICNLIKCRPPENRDPLAEEVACCEPFLQRQLQLLKPQIIVALGRFAAQTLLGVQTPISRLRGHWHSYQGVPLMPTYHPAYLLRSPGDKRLVWNDMKQVKERLLKRQGPAAKIITQAD